MAKKRGRPPKAVKQINPHVTVGRHPVEEIETIDAAAAEFGISRSAWAWPILMHAAKLQKQRKGKRKP